ncbi:MAG: fibronectin type III domain-containing protein, partial [Paenibacillaceae bacterium]|nr:fibronectin type III domain-containing protein [Paenibacillaceae bacterium]
IANLAASSSTSDSAKLTWTAPGDDGNTGTASSYDVRYGIADINDGNWASAAQANGEPAPSVAGSAETMTVTGLSPNTTYYFKIKTADEVPNVSAISTTTVSMATAASGTDTIAPAAIADLQAVAGGTSTTANLQWTASGDDNNTGTAASYDVRYRTTPFTTSNWSSAKKATFLPSPQPAGSVETMTVYGLTPSTLYYFALTATDDAGNESLLSTGTVSYTTLAPTSGTAIVLYPGMVFNEQGRGEADMLVDEPSDPRGGTPTTPTSIWNYGSNNFYYPISVIIDLGIPYQLTDIYYYDGVGSGADGVTFSTGSPAGWTDHFTDKLGQTNKWVGHSFHATTRYVRLYMDECCQKIGEIALYGTPIGTPPAAPTPTPHTRPTMNELMGVNALVDDPADKMAVVEHIREYHNWDWDEGDYNFGSNGNPAAYAGAYPNNLNKFAPTYANSGGWNFDSFYSSLHSGGFTILPAVQASVSWLTPNRWDKPLSAGDSATDPASYVEHADHMFQYAARYGGASVADAKLKLAAGQPRSSGLGTIDYIENANEPDKWWQGLSAYFTPYEFAAMSSADYDGHLGAMGNTAGVKNADASLQMVMGGLTEVKLDYIKALKFWADYYRGGSIPFDVINVHHYSNANPDSNTIGISPEQDKFKEKMEKLVQYRDMYMPNHPVWLTEFGYDTHPNSVQRAPVIGTKSQEGVQADWLVRSYLAAAASGLDRAYAYFLRDANPGSTTKYDTAGLVKGKGDWSPKVSWYYVYTLRNTLGNMRYLAEQSSSTNNLLIYKFKNATGNGGAYAVWLGTSNGGTVANYSLSLSGSPTSATKVTMAAGYTDGVSTPLAISGGTVTVNVSETPIFIVVDDMQ